MSKVNRVVNEIQNLLKENTPKLTDTQKTRMYNILNPDVKNYVIHGIKFPILENIVKSVFKDSYCSYEEAIEIFKKLIRSNVEEEKFAGLHFLNRFKNIYI